MKNLVLATALGGALFIGALSAVFPHAAALVALLLLLLALRWHSRRWGLVALWLCWLLVPALRRIFDLSVEPGGADPMSLLPFLATIAMALMDLREVRLDRRGRRIGGAAAFGFAIGIPVGLLADPAAAMFATLAYFAGLSAFAIGWAERELPAGGEEPTLYRVLAVVMVPLSLYAIAQYFLPLTAWDAQWVESGELGSIGAPGLEKEHVRVFSTLNAPFTFALVLAAALLLELGRRRGRRLGLLYAAPLLLALALTFMRAAWVALVAGALVFAAAARGRAAGRLLAGVGALVVVMLVLGNSSPTFQALTQRGASLGNTEEDISAQDRLETKRRLLPVAASQPLGAGLGQGGLSASLSEGDDSAEVEIDDGYVSLFYQTGPFGVILILAAMFASVGAAWRALGRAPPELRPVKAALLATLAMLLVANAAGEMLYGVTGVIFWYLCGFAVADSSERFNEESGASATRT